MWAAVVVVGAAATVIAWASGARLGAALTLGVVLAIAMVLLTLGVEGRRRGPRGDDPAPPKKPSVPTSARAKRRRR